MMNTTDEIINKWLSGVRGSLVENYDRLGLRASGNWAEQLEPFVRGTQSHINVGILGEQYSGAIMYGRRPNKDQSPDALHKWAGWAGSTFIAEWVKQKGLENILNPFAVAHNIAKNGWEVPNTHNAGGLVSDVVTRKRVDELLGDLSEYFVTQFTIRTKKAFEDGN